MAHLFLIAGHGAGDSGAVGNGYTEAERVRALAQKISDLGGSNVTLGDIQRNWYADKGISSLNIPKDYQILELHMDSSNSKRAHGGHIIIKEGNRPDQYDQALADLIGGIFPGRSDLIVKRGDLANPKRAEAKGYGYRLVEFGFISNAEDVRTFNDKIMEIAEGVLKAFGIKTPAGKNSEKGTALARQAQMHINKVVYANGGKIAVDGIKGKNTMKGLVKTFQIAYNLDTGADLTIDGMIGPKTRAAIENTEMRKGFRGYRASWLEIALLAHGHDPKGVEWPGEIGPGCYAALTQFQKDQNYFGGSAAIAGKRTIMDLLK